MNSKITTLVLLCCFFVMSSMILRAQTMMEITAPSSIQGTHKAFHAIYGMEIGLYDTIQGEFFFVDELVQQDSSGCLPILTDLTGKIAMINRGGCNFSIKSYYAQKQGAIAAVICNEEGRGNVPMSAGTFADSVTIPTIMLDYDLCQTIIMSSDPVSCQMYFHDPFLDRTVVWGDQAGEGDFADSLSGWTSVAITPDTADWFWYQEFPLGAWWTAIDSRTKNNGYAAFDASYYSRDVSGSPPYPRYTSEFISPVIDLSAYDAISIAFFQYNLPLNGDGTEIAYSNDGGTTWNDPIVVETENEFTSEITNLFGTETPEIIIIDDNLSENFQFKFIFNNGDYYSWCIDDVLLLEVPDNNLVMEDAFFAPLSIVTPESQLPTDTFGFSASLLNAGAMDQQNGILKVSIIDDEGNSYYQDSLAFDLSSSSRDTLSFNGHRAELPTGDYYVLYEVRNEGIADDVPEDNSIMYPFYVSDALFAKENAAPENIVRFSTNDADPWYWGNFYTISTESNVNADQWYFSGVHMALAADDGTLDDEILTLYLMKWEDVNDQYPQFTELNQQGVPPVSHDFLTTIAVASVNPQGNLQNELFFVDYGQMFDPNTGLPIEDPIFFESGVTYGLVAELNGSAMGVAGVNGTDPAGTAGLLYNWNSDPRYYSNFTGYYPVIRMEIDEIGATNEAELSTTEAKVYPTLTSDLINIELNLNQKAETHYFITDMSGRLMAHRELGEVKTETLSQSVADYPAGVYYVDVRTMHGSKQIPFTVVR